LANLELINVEVRYFKVILALRGISLEVPQGKIVCLLGANGAGKSTALKAMSGLLSVEDGEVTDGSIEFDGKKIDHLDPESVVKMGIVQVLEGHRVLEHLTVEENLRAAGLTDGAEMRKDIDRVYYYFPALKELRRQQSGYLSGGEQQMLVIGRGLMSHPKLMLLDEPSLGLGPQLVREIFDIVKNIHAEEGTSVLLVEQNAVVALSLADYGYVMENGRVVMDGPASKLRENADIREFYMGISEKGKRKSYREVKHYKRRKRWLA